MFTVNKRQIARSLLHFFGGFRFQSWWIDGLLSSLTPVRLLVRCVIVLVCYLLLFFATLLLFLRFFQLFFELSNLIFKVENTFFKIKYFLIQLLFLNFKAVDLGLLSLDFVLIFLNGCLKVFFHFLQIDFCRFQILDPNIIFRLNFNMPFSNFLDIFFVSLNGFKMLLNFSLQHLNVHI